MGVVGGVVGSIAVALALQLPAGARSQEAERPREILDKAERDLRSTFPDARARAVSRLAKLGGDEAWERVLEALRDREPQVADEAQLALARLEDPRWRARLLAGEGLGHRDEWVRLRVAEAFGRMAAPVPGEHLARALDLRQVDLARTLCWTLERSALGGTLSGDRSRIGARLAGALARSAPGRLAADALAAWVAVDPEGARPALQDALGDERAELRAAALIVGTSIDDAAVLAAARGLAADEASAVRRAAIGCLCARADRGAAAVLVERLESELRPSLRVELVAALQRVSLMRHRDDLRSWRHWLESLPADWRAGDAAPPERPPEGPTTRADVASFPLRSDRIAILVDFSGSLWAPREDGHTRKELLDPQIAGLLGRLGEGAAFNLVPYATEPAPWRPALVPAGKREVTLAARDFERCRLTGKGNVWDAALVALADPQVDTLLIVTDGAPTGGRRWNLGLLVELLVRERRWSGVVIDSVLIDASARLERHWSELAERTGGTSLAVRFDPPAGKGD